VRLDRPFYVLVATANKDDQSLITQSLRGSVATIRLNYAASVEQIQQGLLDQESEYYCFPRLLMLDLQIAECQLVWQLISDIRLSYPLLPIILISSDHRPETVRQAYTSGINAFIKKQTDWNKWKAQLVGLAYYWLKVVTLPKPFAL